MNKQLTITFNRKFFSIMAGLLMLILVTTACSLDNGNGGANVQQVGQQQNNNQAAALDSKYGFPKLTTSNELSNLDTRLKRLNDPNEIGYVYVIAYNLVFGPYQVIGKCSSTESLVSPPMSIDTSVSNGQGTFPVTVPAPQPDGSYGQNEAAIFCFLDDAQKTMIEFNSQWIWVEKPIVGLPTVPGSSEVHDGK